MSSSAPSPASTLQKAYPFTNSPLIVSPPMRPFSTAALSLTVSTHHGLGFLPVNNDPAGTRQTLSTLLSSPALQNFYSANPSFHPSNSTNPSPNLPLPKPSPSNFPPPINPPTPLPIGLGFQIYQESLSAAISLIHDFKPMAIWLFAAASPTDNLNTPQISNQTPSQPGDGNKDYALWASSLRAAALKANMFPPPGIWVQIGTVSDAIEVVSLLGGAEKGTVIVAQGSDSGGHGLAKSAGLITLVPEIKDALAREGKGDVPVLAAGGIMDARGAAASLVLGADGVVMGTRFLMSEEAGTPRGMQGHIRDAWDGGVSTVRTRLFDELRGTGDFPGRYDGRALVNESLREVREGVDREVVRGSYERAVKDAREGKEEGGKEGYGESGRLVSYAGTGVGLVREVMGAGETVEEVRRGIGEVLGRTVEVFGGRG